MAELAAQPTSIQSLYGWYTEDKLLVNRRYQRKLVWTLEEKQKLIESILKKYPIPAVLIAERKDSSSAYEIIDGLQRLQTIMSFIEGAFATSDGRAFDLELFPTAKARATEGKFVPLSTTVKLNQKEVSAILDYSLALSVMRNATENEINDVFDRINTYGHRLSDQERRQAGVQNAFSDMVRDLACTFRGDTSEQILTLSKMPSISIDLPMTRYGYSVKAEEVFWVNQGILRSTDLRDSMDEQCLADIAACIVRGELIDRSKEALDAIYRQGEPDADQTLAALSSYGREKALNEIKYCVEQILEVCAHGRSDKLRDIIFSKRTTNAFPSVFAIIVLAFHELIVIGKQKIADMSGIKRGLHNIADRLEIGRGATQASERRRNVDTVKGLISASFVPGDQTAEIYANHTTVDIESLIRRSEVELSDYELKQGLLLLDSTRNVDKALLDKINKTICAVANNGRERVGKIVIGVTDKAADADRISRLDGISPKIVGSRMIVGVTREARCQGLSIEQYVTQWRESIKNSPMSDDLKNSVLSHIDYNSFYGLGVITITVPPQKDVSYYDGDVYWRRGDTTVQATTPQQIASIAKRF